ncbi:Dbl homology domain-containing protein [Syncephalis plumigaleata]|nr:Dbl homology domain-containing protein [Syncephalis plumigaleata]
MGLANHTDMNHVNRARRQSAANYNMPDNNMPSSPSASASMFNHTMESDMQRPNQTKAHLFKKRPKMHPTEATPESLYTTNSSMNNSKPPLKSLWEALQEEQAVADNERRIMMERKAADEHVTNMPELANLFSNFELSDPRDQVQRTRRKSSAASAAPCYSQRSTALPEHIRGTGKHSATHREMPATPTSTSAARPSIISLAQMRKSYLNNCTPQTNPALEFDLSKLTISGVYPTSDSSTTSSDEVELEWIDNDELEQQEMGRLAAVISLIRREQKHLRALVLIKGAFAEPLYKAHEQARRHPFSNFDRSKLERVFAIPIKMIPFHKLFLRDLELAVEKHSMTGTLSEVITTFNKHMPGFRYYLHYMDKYPEMVSLLDELVMSSDYFRQTLEECTEQVEHVNVRALLGNSREHIAYYYGFLQKIMELYSPEEPEYNGFAQCVAQFQEINVEAEKLARIALQREEAKRIQTSMKGYSGTLATPTRRLIHQGNLAVVSLISGKSALRTCLLFNDMLVFAKEKSDGRLHYKGHIGLESAYATELPPDQFVNLFAIMDSSNKKYYFQAEDEQGCREWVQYVNEVINAI